MMFSLMTMVYIYHYSLLECNHKWVLKSHNNEKNNDKMYNLFVTSQKIRYAAGFSIYKQIL